MSNRSEITSGLVTLFKTINGTGNFQTNIHNNVDNKLLFWDEVRDYPYICVVASDENREYLPSGFKWSYLNISIRIYVKSRSSLDDLEHIIEDIEMLLDANNSLEYTTGKQLTDIRVLSITTDEGLLAPYSVGEIIIQVQYTT